VVDVRGNKTHSVPIIQISAPDSCDVMRYVCACKVGTTATTVDEEVTGVLSTGFSVRPEL
jgi:hypothetical protein